MLLANFLHDTLLTPLRLDLQANHHDHSDCSHQRGNNQCQAIPGWTTGGTRER